MAKLFIAVMYPSTELFGKALFLLLKEFGEVQAQGEEFNFDFTAYYEKEFGKELKKRFLVFKAGAEKGELASIRKRTGEIEEQLSREGKRTVNIDPGYLSGSELVLASKKYRPFKESLGEGIYAHKVLEFQEGKIITFSHTFADYKKYKDAIRHFD